MKRLLKDLAGQDMIEYALVAGFVALGIAAVLPQATVIISQAYAHVHAILAAAGGETVTTQFAR